jgi:hypothetical protein
VCIPGDAGMVYGQGRPLGAGRQLLSEAMGWTNSSVSVPTLLTRLI